MRRRRRGKRRDEEDIQDSLVVEEGMIVKFPLVPFATCLLPLQLLCQGYFHQKEVKQPHCRDTQRPNIMNYVVPPEVPDRLPLTTLPCLPEQCNHCGNNFSKTSSLSKHMLVVHGASRPLKILQDRNLTKLMACRTSAAVGSALPSATSPYRQGSALRST